MVSLFMQMAQHAAQGEKSALEATIAELQARQNNSDTTNARHLEVIGSLL